jgi:hypothetical protein
MPWETARKDPAYGRSAWKRARDGCLKRAQWRCEIRIPGTCIGAASEADHIDGLANDPGHKRLRAACSPCHAVVTARQSNAGTGTRADPKPQPRTAW